MLRLSAAILLALWLACAAFSQEQELRTTSPDQARIASALKRRITVSDAQTGKALMAIQAHTNDIIALAYSPDGKLLASADNGGNLRLFDSATGKQLRSHQTKLKGNGKLSWEKDGSKVALEIDGVRRTLVVATGKEEQ